MEHAPLVATADGLYRAGTRDAMAFTGRDVGALARGSVGMWAIVDGTELWFGDGDWERRTDMQVTGVNCLLEADDRVLAGLPKGRLLVLGPDMEERIEDFSAVDGRDQWFTPWGGPPDVRSLSASGAGVFVNVHVGGILRSEDHGATWTETIDIRSDVHQVLAHGRDVYAATARGLAVSEDDGRSWRFETQGLHAHYCRAVAVCDDAVLLTASVGPYGGRAALYRRSLDGSGFEKCNGGLPQWFGDNIDTYRLDADGTRAAFATSDGLVYGSADSGTTWQLIGEHATPVHALLMTTV